MRAFSSPRPVWHSLPAPLVAVVVFLIVQADNYWLYLAITAATAYILAASFNLLYGYAGIFSLAHVSVYGIGAYAACLFQMNYGIPFIPATLLSMVACSLIGVVLWLPTRRLRDLFLAIATLGFATMVQELMLKWTSLTGGATGLLGIPYASAFGEIPANTHGYYWLAAVCAVLAWEISARMTSSGMGRKMIALRDAPVALSAVGISNSRVRLVAYVVASAMAALAGSLFAHESLFISSESFGLHRLILLILAVLFGGAGTMIGPAIGVVALVFIDEAGLSTGGSSTVILGLSIIVFLGYSRGGLGSLGARMWQRLRPPGDGLKADEKRTALELPKVENDDVLRVDHVSVTFGGVRAMTDVSLVLEPGRVLGLIGPNGAGKTTLVNTVTGYVRPTEGRVLLGDEVVSGRRPDLVVGDGVVRTFQTARLIPDVTVIGNVALGFSRSATAADWAEVLDTPRARRDTTEALTRAAQLLEALDVDTAPGQPVRDQPYATQRLTEIARALATAPRFILLDEPGAGLNEHEREVLARVIRRVADSGIGVLLIDHNVAFVAGVSDTMHVLDGGRTLAEGEPDEVLGRPEVVNAYLGGVV